MRIIAGPQLYFTPVVETRRLYHGISLVGTCKDEGLLLKIEISHHSNLRARRIAIITTGLRRARLGIASGMNLTRGVVEIFSHAGY